MKKFLLLLSVFFFALSLYAQVPTVKFYIQGGSTKEYKIDDIKDLTYIHSNLSYLMTFFQKGNMKTEIDIRGIDSIVYEENQIMRIVLSTETKTYDISSIDSIILVFNTSTEIQIGTQVWMCKNLDVDHYRNGDEIPQVTDPLQWRNLKTGAWCYYDNDPAIGAIYGKLYNWYAVYDPRGLAPTGWHVPSDAEWSTLTTYLGGESIAGGKLKESGTTHWSVPNTGATNESGFTVLPGGYRYIYGDFYFIGYDGFWWSSSEGNSNDAWYRVMYYSYSDAFINIFGKSNGFSVRCVRD